MRLSNALGFSVLLLPVLALMPLITARSESVAVRINPPALDEPASEGVETAVLAGGCFWGAQAVYQHTKGVLNAVSGYAGGDAKDATYQAGNYGRPAHGERVRETLRPP